MLPISYYIKNPKVLCNSLLMRTFLVHLLPDKLFIRLIYYFTFGKKLDLRNPKTFNEKLQWLKLYDRKPEYTTMVDKYAVKKYVADKIGEEYVIPTIGVWDSVDQIDFDKLPNQFVLKTTHGGGSSGVVVCRDKNNLDIELTKRKLLTAFRQKIYLYSREWPYKNVTKRIIAEKYMEDKKYGELRDYKFFCFDGEPKFLFVAKDRMKKGEEVKFNFFDMQFNHLGFKNGHPLGEPPFDKPEHFDKMVELSHKLSKGIPHVRVDLYEINGKIYFGEYTFFHHSGLTPFEPEKWDLELGKYFHLPNTI